METALGLAFVNLSGDAPPLREWLGDILVALEEYLPALETPGSLVAAHRKTYQPAADWKVLVEHGRSVDSPPRPLLRLGAAALPCSARLRPLLPAGRRTSFARQRGRRRPVRRLPRRRRSASQASGSNRQELSRVLPPARGAPRAVRRLGRRRA